MKKLTSLLSIFIFMLCLTSSFNAFSQAKIYHTSKLKFIKASSSDIDLQNLCIDMHGKTKWVYKESSCKFENFSVVDEQGSGFIIFEANQNGAYPYYVAKSAFEVGRKSKKGFRNKTTYHYVKIVIKKKNKKQLKSVDGDINKLTTSYLFDDESIVSQMGEFFASPLEGPVEVVKGTIQIISERFQF